MDAGDMSPLERGTSSVGLESYVGRVFVFEDKTRSSTTGPLLRRGPYGKQKQFKLVKNSSGGVLYSKRGLVYKTGTMQTEVDGCNSTTAQSIAGFVDDMIPSAGVPNGDFFLMAVQGPHLVLSDLAGAANNLIPEGTVLVALTAATSGATTSGRVAPQDLTGATQNLGNQIQNRIGRALSAMTTANTNADVLVDLNLPL